ncbi:MAG: FAD-binding oxidoreductase, partial [Caldilineae bacterium]
RGRANLLRAALTGALPGGLADPALGEALELCLGCKACKSECPSGVDMAKLKAEAYAQKYQTQSPPLTALLFGHIDRVSAAVRPLAPLANAALRFPLSRRLVQDFLHIHPRRSFPPFRRQTFTRLWQDPLPVSPTVALFPDTFTEFNEPEQGLAAGRVLKAAGCRVALTPRRCCGRPLLSQGLIPQARERARSLVDALHPYSERGIPVLGLEPSCVLTIRDDYPDLLPGPRTEAVAQNIFLFDEYFLRLLDGAAQPPRFAPRRQHYIVHGHCYQKALVGEEPLLQALAAIPGARVHSTQAGCCGMAGAFGYDRERYELSVAIAGDRLLPALNELPNAVIVANGASCRHQIADLTGRRAVHLAQALAEALVE